MQIENDRKTHGEEKIVLTPQEARAGRMTGVIRILTISLTLAILIGVGLLLYF